MLDSCKFIPLYNSYDNDLINEFYIPAFSNSVYVDRISAYFSGKALSMYSQGLEVFEKNNGKYRLIISNEISEEDFSYIKEGYDLKEKFISSSLDSFDDFLNSKDILNLSNLAYLIAIGIVEIKIAFTIRGVFHDKCAIFKDSSGNEMCMRGSNNETLAAIKDNFESFDITCSWLASQFDLKKSNKQILILTAYGIIQRKIFTL